MVFTGTALIPLLIDFAVVELTSVNPPLEDAFVSNGESCAIADY